jgi:hypothetical protein
MFVVFLVVSAALQQLRHDDKPQPVLQQASNGSRVEADLRGNQSALLGAGKANASAAADIARQPAGRTGTSGVSFLRKRIRLDRQLHSQLHQWTVGMQLCPHADEWTLHGLWPNTDACTEKEFDPRAISSIKLTLEAKWSSCYGTGAGNEDFWQHEWQKHGTCSGMDELTYFNTALALQGKYNNMCSGWKNKHACGLPCTGTTAEDIQCSAPQDSLVGLRRGDRPRRRGGSRRRTGSERMLDKEVPERSGTNHPESTIEGWIMMALFLSLFPVACCCAY